MTKTIKYEHRAAWEAQPADASRENVELLKSLQTLGVQVFVVKTREAVTRPAFADGGAASFGSHLIPDDESEGGEDTVDEVIVQPARYAVRLPLVLATLCDFMSAGNGLLNLCDWTVRTNAPTALDAMLRLIGPSDYASAMAQQYLQAVAHDGTTPRVLEAARDRKRGYQRGHR